MQKPYYLTHEKIYKTDQEAYNFQSLKMQVGHRTFQGKSLELIFNIFNLVKSHYWYLMSRNKILFHGKIGHHAIA